MSWQRIVGPSLCDDSGQCDLRLVVSTNRDLRFDVPTNRDLLFDVDEPCEMM
ncbi:MAG: hypothetical protein ABS879_04350 [Eubacteriales bacterium]